MVQDSSDCFLLFKTTSSCVQRLLDTQQAISHLHTRISRYVVVHFFLPWRYIPDGYFHLSVIGVAIYSYSSAIRRHFGLHWSEFEAFKCFGLFLLLDSFCSNSETFDFPFGMFRCSSQYILCLYAVCHYQSPPLLSICLSSAWKSRKKFRYWCTTGNKMRLRTPLTVCLLPDPWTSFTIPSRVQASIP